MTRPMILGAAAAVLLAGCGDPAPADNAAAADAAASPPAPAPTPPAAAPSAWAGLRDDVGKYPRDIALFETSAIADDLKALLGDRFDTFKTDMQVQGPLAEEGGVLWTSGNKPHEGGEDMAYLLIDPAAQQIEVGLWHDGELRTYATPGAAIAKPADVLTMIDNARNTP